MKKHDRTFILKTLVVIFLFLCSSLYGRGFSRGKKPGAASPVHGKALETRSSPRIHPPPQTPEDEPDPPDQEVQEAPPPEAEPIRTEYVCQP